MASMGKLATPSMGKLATPSMGKLATPLIASQARSLLPKLHAQHKKARAAEERREVKARTELEASAAACLVAIKKSQDARVRLRSHLADEIYQ